MNHDEQRVRTMAGWVGVEISRSRVRTAGKAGYGLYRVRTSAERHWHGGQPPVVPVGEWTAYLFELEDIKTAVTEAIERGTPAGPGPLRVRRAYPGKDAAVVPTRWTQAYRGRRDLGVWMQQPGLCGRPQRHVDECVCMADGKARWIEDEPIPVQVKPEFAALVTAVVPLVGAGLVTMVHVEGCCCDDDRYAVVCLQATATSRQVQRAGNAAFQAEHLKARESGLRARYAAKRGRLGGSQHSGGQLGPQSGSEGDSGPR